MWVFWVLSLIPIAVCGFFLIFDKEVSWVEWLISFAVSILMAIIFQVSATHGMTKDIETWSGYVTQPRQYSRWKEYYEYAVYRTETYACGTDSKGNTEYCTREMFDHWESDTRWHEEHWGVSTTLGDWGITKEKYVEICKKFNDCHPINGVRVTGEHNSRMIAGDPYDYVADNKTGWIEPVTDTRNFENRVKAAPSLFSYSKVPTNISVFSWPKSTDLFVSERVLGTAKLSISTLKWDQMNAILGPTKKVNVIIVGFGNQGMTMAGYQESAWIGGKKNDLIICYGGEPKQKATWVKVFGWTERNIVKENLQTLLLDNPVDNNLISEIKKEIDANYVIKDWSKFDYITIEPPTWSYWVYLLTMVLVHGTLLIVYHKNEIDKYSDGTLDFFNNLTRRFNR